MDDLDQLTARYRRQQKSVLRKLTRELAIYAPGLSMKNIDKTSPAWIAAVTAAVQPAHDSLSDIAKQFYGDYRRANGVTSPYVLAQVKLNVGKLKQSLTIVGAYQAKQLMGGGALIPEVAQRVFTDATGTAIRSAMSGARNTVATTALGDGMVVGYGRATSPGCCHFCAMVAANLYQSAESAGQVIGRRGSTRGAQAMGKKYHDHCRCFAVPVYSYTTWRDGSQVKAFADIGDSVYDPNQTQAEYQKRFFDAYAAKSGREATNRAA